jgi:hypothetical protein
VLKRILATASLLMTVAVPVVANEVRTVDVQLEQRNIFTSEKVFAPNDEHTRRFYARFSIEGPTLKIAHVTKFIDPVFGPYNEFVHPVTAIKKCDFDGFDKTNCAVEKGDIVILPEGKKASDYSFQIAYSESGLRFQADVSVDDAALASANAPVDSSPARNQKR